MRLGGHGLATRGGSRCKVLSGIRLFTVREPAAIGISIAFAAGRAAELAKKPARQRTCGAAKIETENKETENADQPLDLAEGGGRRRLRPAADPSGGVGASGVRGSLRQRR